MRESHSQALRVQRVSVGLSDMTLGVGYCCEVGTISMQKPDGTVLLAPMNFNNAGAATASRAAAGDWHVCDRDRSRFYVSE